MKEIKQTNKTIKFDKIYKLISRSLYILRFWEILNKVQIVIISIILYGILIGIKPITFYFKSLIFMFSYITYGYLLNDYIDFNKDTIKKKHLFSKNKIGLFVILFAILNLAFYFILRSYNFSFGKYSLFFYIISIFLITFYSVPPIRFKEKGFLGVVIGSIQQRLLPFLILVFIYNKINLPLILLIAIILLIHGIIVMIAHQILDYKNDIKSKTKTWVTNISLKKAGKIFKLLIIFFFIIVFFISLIISFKIFIVSLIILLILIPEIEWAMLAYKELIKNG